MGSGAKISAMIAPQAKSAALGVTFRSGSHTSPMGQRLAMEMPCPSSMSLPLSASLSVWWARW
jgi:hypothetical protein